MIKVVVRQPPLDLVAMVFVALLSLGSCEIESPFLDTIIQRIADDVEEALPKPEPPVVTPEPVVPYVTMSSPNGGEAYVPGQDVSIAWLSNVPSRPVRVELRKGDATTLTISGETMNSGSYAWTIPVDQEEGDDYRVFVAIADDASINDESDGVFSIGSMVVSYPNGGETLAFAGSCTITWVSSHPGTVAIDVGKDGSWTQLATGEANDGSYQWSPIDVAGGEGYRVRVRSEMAGYSDESNGTFAVVDDSLALVSPGAGAFSGAGTQLEIAWTGVLHGNVKIELYTGSTLAATLAANTVNSGAFGWSVPSGQAARNDYRIKVTTLTTPSYSCLSEPFTIESIALTAPSGGVVVAQGSARSITWNSSGRGFVKLELFKGASSTPVAVISTSTENDGTHSWTPSQAPAGDYRLRVTSLDVPTQYGEGSAFTIEKIAVSAPSSGQLFAVGQSSTVYWSSSGTGSVDIVLLRGGTVVSTVLSTPNDGDYTWTFATGLSPGANYIIRVRRSEATGIYGDSAQFAVERLTVTGPNGGAVYPAGASCPISWTGSGLGNVRIELLKGGVVDQVVSASAANNGSFSWTIPSAKTSGYNYRIRVSHASVPSQDDSDANFIVTRWTYLGKPTTSKSDSPEIVVDSDNVPFLLYKDYAYPGVTGARPVVKRWSTGTSWVDLGVAFLGPPEYHQIALRSDGKPVVAGRNVTVNYPVCYRWTSGTSWTSDGLPMGNSADAYYLSLAVASDNKPILALTELSTNRTKVISGFAYPWASLGYLSASGNYGAYHSMALGSDGKPFVAFVELTNSPQYYYVRTRKYSSGTSWIDYGTLSDFGLYISSVIDPADGKPIVMYVDYPGGAAPGHLVVKKWSSGTSWTDYGTLHTGSISGCDIVVAGDGLVMAAYRDETYEIRVKVWQGGTSWADLGYISSNQSVDPRLAVGPDNLPVLAFQDNLLNDQDNVVVYKWK